MTPQNPDRRYLDAASAAKEYGIPNSEAPSADAARARLRRAIRDRVVTDATPRVEALPEGGVRLLYDAAVWEAVAKPRQPVPGGRAKRQSQK